MNVLELAKAAAMDLTSGYIFGSKVGTNFLGDVGYRRRWLQAFGVFQTQSRRERAWGEIERFCVDMCEAAEASLHEPTRGDDKATTKKDDAGYNTKPVVYEQLSQRIGSSSSDGNKSVGGLETTKTEAIASELLDHLIAGHESTGITLMYVMYELSLRQDITRRLRVELLSTLSPLSLRFPSSSTNNKRPDNDGDGSSRIDDDLPKPSAIDALPLLDAVLQETLRLWQAVPAPQPRVTPYYSSTAASLSIDGYDKIPGGVTVSSNAYTLHRNPDVFPNPEAWMPERWLEADKERRQEMKRWLWTFSSGGRMCLGSNFAIQTPAAGSPFTSSPLSLTRTVTAGLSWVSTACGLSNPHLLRIAAHSACQQTRFPRAMGIEEGFRLLAKHEEKINCRRTEEALAAGFTSFEEHQRHKER
ncbi:MAG: hypothetical protein Q9205_007472 [Flavoplaca limonia]